MNEKFVKEMVLGTVNKCGSCGHLYEMDNVAVVGREEELWLLMMSCPVCSSRGLVAAVVKDQAKTTAIHNAPDRELQVMKNLEIISTDDVLSVHEFLKEFNGDFISLFNKRQ